MADDPLPSLADLERRLTEARKTAAGEPVPEAQPATSNAYGSAMRMGVEFVSGFLVGGLIGWVLDDWLGTRPWLMVVFFFLGAAAGMLNVIRIVRRMQAEAEAEAGKDK